MVSMDAQHCAPTFGRFEHYHVWESGIGRLRPMRTPRQVLSENLKALMAHREDRGTLKKITAASRGKLTNGTLGRVRAATHATTVDTLGDLAEVFALEPWQLLVPDLKPEALPQIAGAELLETIRSLVAGQDRRALLPDTHQAQPSGKKDSPGRFHGQVIGTGSGKGKTGEVNQPGTAPKERRRGRS